MKALQYIILASATLALGISCQHGNPEDGSRNTSTNTNYGDPALDKLSRQIALDSSNAELYAQRGELLYDLKYFDEGISDLNKAIALDSMQPVYYHKLADMYLDYYRSRQALNAIENAAARFPKRIPTLLKLAEFQWILQQYTDALFSLERIRTIDPLNAEMFFMFGNVFRDTHRPDQAINAYQSCVENDPENIDAWIELGQLLAAKNIAAAERYFDNALRIDSNNIPALHAKAYFLSNKKDDLPAALTIYKKINTLNPRYVDGYYNAGLLYLDMDSLDRAYQSFDIAVNMAPTFSHAFFHRGVTSELKGNTASAIRDYENTLRLEPEYEGAKAGLLRLQGK